ncbi:RagB/SusD family nutrient uptake outer membrane protein [uncultured Bacteroides sp.]|uniref:RagB/SusD family nutrient uptake outer membrane protein n=1 Tax=uncultured Bacteroides sp. TaxID=162156 RepID=UPI002AABB155|nr:RagB/SusD family nutrient uptake outer membrane protein [uncultured Bacteroides sp.]
MKTKILTSTFWIFFIVISVLFSSCDGFLSTMPKGAKTPSTLADYEAFIRNEYTTQCTDIMQAVLLLNDKFETASNYNYYPLRKANYFWDESANRIELNNTDEFTYYNGYAAISSCNLIIENVPSVTGATDAQKNELIAQAKVIRTVVYFVLANYYADTYDEATAATKLSVPLIESADLNASYKQVTIQEIYNYMLKNLEEALPYLPHEGATALHPTIGAAYAMYARIYLEMGNYDLALQNANKALAENSALYDWTLYYQTNKTQIENANDYTATTSPMGIDNVENYYFRHGTTYYASSESKIQVDRRNRFEEGDARMAARWKLKTVGTDTYYTSTLVGLFNYGGLTTTEVYLIKAECLARDGKYGDAMDVLNTVRQKRILPNVYQPLTASTEEQAINYIRRTKDNELIFSIVPFADARRFNKETKYARTLSKVVDGTTYTLTPNSHLWTMPFPMGATNNPGNGTIIQNVDK